MSRLRWPLSLYVLPEGIKCLLVPHSAGRVESDGPWLRMLDRIKSTYIKRRVKLRPQGIRIDKITHFIAVARQFLYDFPNFSRFCQFQLGSFAAALGFIERLPSPSVQSLSFCLMV
jgi:hypothetical protein